MNRTAAIKRARELIRAKRTKPQIIVTEGDGFVRLGYGDRELVIRYASRPEPESAERTE